MKDLHWIKVSLMWLPLRAMNLSIPVNRRRIPGALLFYVGVSVLWALLMLTQNFGRQYTVLFGISMAMLLLRVSLLLADYIKTLFDGRARLIITPEGMDDQRSIFSCGMIPWSDVRGVELYQMRRTKILVVRMADAEALMKAQPFWKRVFLREMSKKFGTPVLVSQSSVNYDLGVLHDELHSLVSPQVE
jgi:hypothetical protein